MDYAECEVPMQLSAEIDRYNWTPGEVIYIIAIGYRLERAVGLAIWLRKTPYMTSAGGIVGMSP